MKKIKLIILTLLITLTAHSNNDPRMFKNPSWVKKTTFSDNSDKEVGGFRYLLCDSQDNIAEETYYRHYAIKILNTEGIQEMSDITIVHDPSYERLKLHSVVIIREGEEINKITDSKIQTLQRETDSERSLYDGSLSTIINLHDVRVDDIIEYSYSIVGNNPVNKGHYSNTFYIDYTFPVEKVNYRVITDKKRKLIFKTYLNCPKPNIKKTIYGTEYSFTKIKAEQITYDNNVPYWFEGQKKVLFTTFSNWEEVVKWAIPLFEYDKNKKLDFPSIPENKTIEEKIVYLVQFIQDEIRYLGFEGGINGFKPHSPQKVYNQRYGDCKDKSLLLVALLRQIDIEAYPLLLHSDNKHITANKPPSNIVFNHCVVNFKLNDKDYFIDPTISNQGGDLNNISFPDYCYGLLVKKGEKDLIKIPSPLKPTVDIQEKIYIDSIGGKSRLEIVSKYTGSKADYMRSYFDNYALADIEKEYLDYYSNLYSTIEKLQKIEFIDTTRTSVNEFIVKEKYNIPDFWLTVDNDSLNIYCETYPLVLESLIDYPKSSKRTMPYYISSPYIYSQTSTLFLPEIWNAENSYTEIKNNIFTYKNTVKSLFKTIEVKHEYEVLQEYIEKEEVNNFLKKNSEINTNFNYQLTYNPHENEFKISWLTILLSLISIVFSVIFLLKIHKKFNPKPIENASNSKIGGWMILPIIGISITPIILIIDFIEQGFFNANTWNSLLEFKSKNTFSLITLVASEIIYNCCFFCFSILVIIHLYTKRSSVPVLICLLYTLSLLVPILDSYLASILIDDQTFELFSKETIIKLISMLIWIPYFFLSENSQNTFTKIYKTANG
ncbi:DUF3857 domain-containing protein [Wenyingzhuangia marina]|uniref:Transglutaminase-like enzyme, putative cysteine protease n=1 Tax=Wenyingzhuangia marina TaxID=1195760 RepID=A0A1M5SR64_9FLAO|nr:DUF3857 domain-containing protein [Wenyingzhuangia marina]GGF63307.1 hypothetical protein GCM10011397_02920 [Wenyingzhuangia marina]SHH40463.1 Transglutaminase-like enzyme, putative cysteine protease [Wenyingzhuangia marina]